ncbi:MAG: hypothetical protein WC584_04495, partial [Candidatus Pacearchaeota archaeon]
DGDGLTNSQEATIGTYPNNRDTDGDGFLDGIEAVNPALDGNPTSNTNPDLGHWLYNFATTQNLTTGTLTNSLNPFWFIGGRIAYIESDANFANGGIYIKNVRDLTQTRRQLTTGLDAQLRELSSTPRGAFVYFHDTLPNGKSGIYKINRLNGNVTRAVPTATQTLDYNIRNPSITGRLVIEQDGTLTTSGNVWLVAETDNLTTATGQIEAYKLQTTVLPLNPGFGSWDGTNVKQITNLPNRIARPKTSRDGDKIMFQEVNNLGKTRLMIYNGLQDVLAGSTSALSDPFGPSGDLRGDALTFFDVNYGVAFPGGFGGANNFIYFAQDQNDVYRLTTPLNFSGADFDIIVASVGVDSSTGRFGLKQPGKVRIPLPGNQITPAVSKEGRRLAFADDYLSDGVPGGNFNLYATSIAPLAKIRQNMDTGMLDGFVDPSGLTFYGGRGDQEIDLTNAVPDDGYSTNTLAVISPLKAVSDAGSYGVTNIGRFGPSGLRIKYNSSDRTTSESLRMQHPWNVEDLVLDLDDSGAATSIDESTIQPYFYNNTTQLYEVLPADQRVSMDRPNRLMRYFVQHFSEYALGGNLIHGNLEQQPSAAKREWELYE